jgi:hypothetical protein
LGTSVGYYARRDSLLIALSAVSFSSLSKQSLKVSTIEQRKLFCFADNPHWGRVAFCNVRRIFVKATQDRTHET